MDFTSLLKLMASKKASDLFITAGVPPSIKVSGKISPVSKNKLNAEQAKSVIYQIMTTEQQREFERKGELNFALFHEGIGRFRVNVYRHQNQAGMVLRRIETEIPTIRELALPQTVEDIAMVRQGLVILIGGTGAGKSTTLAAMINHRNHHSQGHIICIEDPIEYVHTPATCIITQREVGIDTENYEIALKNALRQAPDMIVIGEIRSRDTMGFALQCAETGHLCVATLHAANTAQALDRITSFFSDENHNQLLLELSLNLRAIVGQRLIACKDGDGACVATEILLNTPLMAKHIRRYELDRIRDVIIRSQQQGMRTFDQSLFELYEQKRISYEDAIQHADSANDLRLKIKLSQNPPTGQLADSMINTSLMDPDA